MRWLVGPGPMTRVRADKNRVKTIPGCARLAKASDMGDDDMGWRPLSTVRSSFGKTIGSLLPTWLHFGMVKNSFKSKDWKSVSFGVWVAPGALETLAKGGGLRPPPF